MQVDHIQHKNRLIEFSSVLKLNLHGLVGLNLEYKFSEVQVT